MLRAEHQKFYNLGARSHDNAKIMLNLADPENSNPY